MSIHAPVPEPERKTWAMWIGGQAVPALSNQVFETVNPATGEVLGTVPRGGEEDVDRAVQAARVAFRKWRKTSAWERGAMLRRLAGVLERHFEELALLDCLDSGNPIREARNDLRKAIDNLLYYSGLALELKGETIPATAEHLHFTVREPYGVVGAIIPFNHPLMFCVNRAGAALVTGNCVVVKPAEQTPLSALRFAELSAEVLPAGVLNVVTGLGPEAGAALVRHPDVLRIAFTGGVETGRRVLQEAAASPVIKRVSLELGGKNPILIFPGVDVGRAAAEVVRGMNFARCQGQSCGSTSRAFVHVSLHDDLLQAVVEHTRAIRLGLPHLEQTEMGALVSEAHLQRVLAYVESGLREGARLVLGGRRVCSPELSRGFFMEPTIFDEVRPEMRIAREEIFGPVLSVLTWSDYDELMEQVNGLAYGLTASVFARDIDTALRAASDVDVGYVWINGVERRFRGVPFGGHKNSGMGVEHSLEELRSYTQLKSINVLVG